MLCASCSANKEPVRLLLNVLARIIQDGRHGVPTYHFHITAQLKNIEAVDNEDLKSKNHQQTSKAMVRLFLCKSCHLMQDTVK